VDDDLRFVVTFCLGDGTPAEDGYFGDGGCDEHLLEDGRADQPCCAGEHQMHCVFGSRV